MFLPVDPSSGLPVYRQITDQVRRMLVSGRLAPGERLPSIRDLAVQLRINPLTVGRAYGDLEREGLIEMRRGLGMYVRQQERLIRPIDGGVPAGCRAGGAAAGAGSRAGRARARADRARRRGVLARAQDRSGRGHECKEVAMTNDAVQFSNVTKRFGKVDALAGLTLAIPKGSVVGLLGRNGAGKTTALRCLVGLQVPDSGEVRSSAAIR